MCLRTRMRKGMMATGACARVEVRVVCECESVRVVCECVNV